MTFDSFASR